MLRNTLDRLFLIAFLALPRIAEAGSAESWNQYQESRNPLAELLMLVGGAAAFVLLLWGLNKLEQIRKSKRG